MECMRDGCANNMPCVRARERERKREIYCRVRSAAPPFPLAVLSTVSTAGRGRATGQQLESPLDRWRHTIWGRRGTQTHRPSTFMIRHLFINRPRASKSRALPPPQTFERKTRAKKHPPLPPSHGSSHRCSDTSSALWLGVKESK